MKLPEQQPKPPEMTNDGFEIDWIASLRVDAKSKYLSMPQRAAALSNLPEQHRFGIPREVARAQRQYEDILK